MIPMQRKELHMKKWILMSMVLVLVLSLLACTAEPPIAAFEAYRANGATVELGAEAAPILDALGACRASAATNSCYGDGYDVVYEYESFRVQTYSLNGVEYILSVTVFDDTNPQNATTAEGISIGATKASVIETYGTPDGEDSFKLVYINEAIKTNLQFSISDGIVTKIDYLKAE